MGGVTTIEKSYPGNTPYQEAPLRWDGGVHTGADVNRGNKQDRLPFAYEEAPATVVYYQEVPPQQDFVQGSRSPSVNFGDPIFITAVVVAVLSAIGLIVVATVRRL